MDVGRGDARARHRDQLRRDRGGVRDGRRRRRCRASSARRSTSTCPYGGVVPEIASRAHLELLNPVIARAIVEAGIDERRIDAVACTVGPGLIGALLVGVSAAKALALVVGRAVRRRQPPRGAPLRGACSTTRRSSCRSSCCSCRAATRCCRDARPRPLPPARARRSTMPPARRSTRSPASSGSAIPAARRSSEAAASGDPAAIAFPRAMLNDGLDFSFSGLKTAVINHVRKHPDVATADVAASFQAAVVDVLVHKARRAAREVGAKGLALGGGVAANSMLRERPRSPPCDDDGLHGVPAEPGDVHRQRGDDRRRRLAPPAPRRPEPARHRRLPQPPARHRRSDPVESGS